MPWNTLTSFADGGTPTHTQINRMNENMEWLKAPPTASFVDTAGTDYTTTSATWGTISSSFSKTLVTTGGHVLALFSASARRLDLDISMDGTRVTSSGTAGTGMFRDNTGNFKNVNLPYVWDNLAAGTHTFAVQWKVPAAVTGTIEGAYQPRFYVRELG